MSPYSHSSWLLELYCYCISWFHGTLHRRTRNNSFAHLICCSKKILPYLPAFGKKHRIIPFPIVCPRKHRPVLSVFPTQFVNFATFCGLLLPGHSSRAKMWSLLGPKKILIIRSLVLCFFPNEIDIYTCDNHVIHFLGLDQVWNWLPFDWLLDLFCWSHRIFCWRVGGWVDWRRAEGMPTLRTRLLNFVVGRN